MQILRSGLKRMLGITTFLLKVNCNVIFLPLVLYRGDEQRWGSIPLRPIILSGRSLEGRSCDGQKGLEKRSSEFDSHRLHVPSTAL